MDETETPRGRFEAWLKRRGTPPDREGDGYAHPYAQDCWEAYQVGYKDGRASLATVFRTQATL